MEYKFTQGEHVKVSLMGAFSGYGIVRGCASSAVPVLGCQYIIEVTECIGDIVIPNETYPFTHIAVQEIYLEKV